MSDAGIHCLMVLLILVVLTTRTGDLTLMSGDLILDAGGENIKFQDDGTEVGQIHGFSEPNNSFICI